LAPQDVGEKTVRAGISHRWRGGAGSQAIENKVGGGLAVSLPYCRELVLPVTSERTAEILDLHPFTRGLSSRHAALLAGMASERHFDAGSYVWRQGQQLDGLLLIVSGEASLEITIPGKGAVEAESVTAGEVLGDWLAGARSDFDARALTTLHTAKLDGRALRQACERDQALGYELSQRRGRARQPRPARPAGQRTAMIETSSSLGN
jgi:CRP/FNR family cyclic AMP-dependent transcriptional regulator